MTRRGTADAEARLNALRGQFDAFSRTVVFEVFNPESAEGSGQFRQK